MTIDRCLDQLMMLFRPGRRSRELIGRRFVGIKLSIWTVDRYLKQWRFKPQEPLLRVYEQDPEVVRKLVDLKVFGYPEAGQKRGWIIF